MKILVLCQSESPIVKHLISLGEEVTSFSDPIDPEYIRREKYDWIISHGYRHIIRKDVIDLLSRKIINLHISYLPWNRGADPNFWSHVDGTPKGVSIHFIDEGLDTGEILVQREVAFSEADTLKTSYEKLQKEIFGLFTENWDSIKLGKLKSRPQTGKGSSHRTKDKEKLAYLTEKKGFDTPIVKLKR